jgi:hypothetical protein
MLWWQPSRHWPVKFGGELFGEFSMQKWLVVCAVIAATPSPASGYIHVPPTTLKTLCNDSGSIRVLTVKACDKDRGVVTFDVGEELRSPRSGVTSFRLVVPPDAPGRKPVLEWMAVGNSVVLFSSEGDSGENTRALGYAFIDEGCYLVDYNAAGAFWLFVRAEPQLSACYHGPSKALRMYLKLILEGKEPKIPTAAAIEKVDHKQRVRQIEDAINKNQADR